ncbi:hypothetical protein [Limnohabitans sp. Rim8]|uniref:hypothetical protein n=1 Tax=Limnohabitans sp. Rim8 TaxID=1100718 RepID=UPI0011B20B13|nr:hypothetical protein [Limnohabitans sp. Rim8]
MFNIVKTRPVNTLEARVVFCVWAGNNAMSDQRLQALFSIYNHLSCPIAYLNHVTSKQWELPDAPFHPAFKYLSETHKADYLRGYLMHHYGGGYTDIKHTFADWRPHFEAFAQSDQLCAGYTEISPHSVAKVGGEVEQKLRDNYDKLIGLCAFIFKPHTPMTHAWIKRTHAVLDSKLPALQTAPASFPQDQLGYMLPTGKPSTYPLKWTEILGDIFHPLILEYQECVLHLPMAPDFKNYR